MASKKTEVVSIRLSREVLAKIDKRIRITGTYRTRSGYLRDRITYDITRKHKKYKGSK